MEILRSLILGIVQGITEFLPISSTAHLIIVPWLFSWEDKGLVYSVALHFGSLFAVLFYFRKDLHNIVNGFFECVSNRSFKNSVHGKTGLYLIIGTIPALIFGFLFEGYASGMFRDPVYVAILLFVFGLLLYFSENRSKKEKGMDDINLVDCLFFGVAQSIAIFPGVSRAGVTITGGLLRNYKRDEAAKFSFLLGIPTIIGAIILEFRHIEYGLIITPSFFVGVIGSFVSAFLVIKFLLLYLKTGTFTPFIIYRILISVFIIILVFVYKI
ncbi:MAG: undecaprenyl-diphosphatase UppP [Candidatus Dadabacteria bacterium]|nr:undecaprenyl-diphosphatase UppP [Candidatus Dadabacteria bacterium]NIQ13462.1 undecaprenyl-diphosphatase UppP [Candidatus Dadabacteria bacterium]